MTITEKIFAAHCGKDKIKAGELIEANIDFIMCHDVTTPPSLKMLKDKGIDKVFDPDKIIITPDHFIPNKDIASAQLAKDLRDWAKEKGIKHFYDLGCHGVCHAIIPEKGFCKPGLLAVGADSHTCTYGAFGMFSTGIGSTDNAYAIATGKLWFRVPKTLKFVLSGQLKKGVYAKDVILEIISRISVSGALDMAMEFSGEIIEAMSMEERMTVCNMAIESGGKSGIIVADQKTIDFVNEATGENLKLSDFEEWFSDEEAEYKEIYKWDMSDLDPVVAVPHLPENVKKVSEVEVKIDQAYLGSCTNGRISDLRIAAEILKGKKVANGVRMLVVPATTKIWKQAMKEGLFEIFVDAGATVSTPTCGACLGGHMGVLAKGEKCISSTNRNFVGRMGHPESEVYLASPATVAVSAIKGKICGVS